MRRVVVAVAASAVAFGVLTAPVGAKKVAPGVAACRLVVKAQSQSITTAQRAIVKDKAVALLRAVKTQEAQLAVKGAELARLGRYCTARYTASVIGTPVTTTTTQPAPPTTTLSVQPQHFEGSGDFIVDLPAPIMEAAVVHVTGNSDSRYFGVTAYSAANTRLEGLVNTTDPYDGRRPLNFTGAEDVAHFEVKASSGWTIDVEPLESQRRGTSPGVIEGDGDAVILISGAPTRAHVVGNAESRYFGVTGYRTSRSGLVNTTDPYDGIVLVPSTANFAFEIVSEGHWRIEFS